MARFEPDSGELALRWPPMTAPATETYIKKEATISGVIRDLRSSAPAECLVSKSGVSSAHLPCERPSGTRGLGTGYRAFSL